MSDDPGFEISGIDPSLPADLAKAVWEKDPSAWGPGEDDPAERLGWLTLQVSMREELARLAATARSVVDDGIAAVTLLGMGGSSLAPEVFFETFGSAPGHPDLIVLDSTHPAQVRAVRDSLDLERTLWLVSSKSGTTVETMSLYRYFRDLQDRGDRFVAVTDPGTPLEDLARRSGFRDTFLNPPDVGGRYSALSLFGLVPGALIGAELDALLASAGTAAQACGPGEPPERNPGLAVGSAMGEAAKGGRDKLTFVTSDAIASFGDWLEQLIAESTGKKDTGIVPVVGEPRAPASRYGDDRIFAWIHLAEDDSDEAFIEELRSAGHPVIETRLSDPTDLGAQIFMWEFATALAGAVLGINAFDQPNVEAAKRASKQILASGEDVTWDAGDPGRLFDGIGSGELAVIVAFAPRDDANDEVLAAARHKLLSSSGVATMRGFGPRYLHSTGQLQKGGPPRVRAAVALDVPAGDEPIPADRHGFARLVSAQALGDVRALRQAGRPVVAATWADLVDWARS